MNFKLLKWLPVLAISSMLYGAEPADEVAFTSEGSAMAVENSQETNSQEMNTLANGQDMGSSTSGSQNPCCNPCIPAKIMPNPSCKVCQDPCCPPMAVYERNINPPAACPLSPCSSNFYAVGTFIYWRADEADFSLALRQNTDYVASTPTSIGTEANGNVVQFSYNWDPGFRIALGWQSRTFESWDLTISWTWFRDYANLNTAASTGTTSGFIPYWGLYDPLSGGVTEIFGQINASARLLYNMIDIDLGRDFFVSCGLSLRPYISVEGGWINRQWRIAYSNPPADFDTPDAVTNFSNKANYWGIGPRAGLGGNWWLGKYFKVYGNLAASVLSGSVNKNFAHFTHATTTDIVPPSNTWSNGSVFRIVPHLQVMAGLGWDTCFCCNRYRLAVSAGWEVNQFWNVPMALYPDRTNFPGTLSNPIFNRENRSHNVGLAGVNFEVKFEF